jgi:hypothetical protein
MWSGPPPCTPAKLPPGTQCLSEPDSGVGRRPNGHVSTWATVTWRVGTFRAVLGRVRTHGWNKDFRAYLHVPVNTPIGRAQIHAYTPRYRGVSASVVVVSSRRHADRISRRVARATRLPYVPPPRVIACCMAGPELPGHRQRSAGPVRMIAVVVTLSAISAFAVAVLRRRATH